MIKSCVFFLFIDYSVSIIEITVIFNINFNIFDRKKKQICLNNYKLRPNTKKVPTKKKKIHTQKIAFNASASWPTIAGSDLTRQSMFRLCPPSALNRSRRSSTAVHTRFSYALVSSRKTAALYAVSRGHFPSLSLGAFDVSVCVGVCVCVFANVAFLLLFLCVHVSRVMATTAILLSLSVRVQLQPN